MPCQQRPQIVEKTGLAASIPALELPDLVVCGINIPIPAQDVYGVPLAVGSRQCSSGSTVASWLRFLLPGKVHYAFVVDGKTILDPSNPRSELYTDDDGKRG